jgi:YidC/Oxa1 family membrane protein insertase
MEQQRTLLLIALFVVMFLIWDAWQRDYVEPQSTVTTQTQQSPTTQQAADDEVPVVSAPPRRRRRVRMFPA